ncbi:MAG: DUF3524 domain-containing protein [Planctomycetota bacterium]
MRRILVLEPYDGGSHARFLNDLARQFPNDHFERMSLPARSWKWRMRFAAIEFAKRCRELDDGGAAFDFIIASTFINLAEFRALAPAAIGALPSILYFHENQLAYPNQVADKRDVHFGITNIIAALAATRLVFNTRYNLDSFLGAIPDLIRKAPDMDLGFVLEELCQKSNVFPVPLDLDLEPSLVAARSQDASPIVVWNHRWEHDKAPEAFFQALFALADQGLDFRVAVAGQNFEHRPKIFDEAKARLGPRICQWGAVKTRVDYLELLRRSTVCVSTALHEFQGLSVLEAAAQGCHLVLPDRLSYPELFPSLARYDNRPGLERMLNEILSRRPAVDEALVERAREFAWSQWRPVYDRFFEELAPDSLNPPREEPPKSS